jgi:integrase/recombinase XerC
MIVHPDSAHAGALAPLPPQAGALDLLTTPAARLCAAFLAGRSKATWRAYRQDLADFAGFAGGAGPEDVAALLLARGQGGANELALAYRADLQARGLAAATVNRRLAALRSLVKLARTLGQVAWALQVEGVRASAYRDTAGPGAASVRRMAERLAARSDPKALRDRAVLRLLFDLGLRRGEVSSLDVGHYDPEGPALSILGKGRAQRERLTLPPATAQAVGAWLAVHPRRLGGELPPSAPLFVALNPAARLCRLTGNGVYRVVRRLGEAQGVRARPHGIRHSSITRLLDLGEDVRSVQRFSRHRSIQTVLRYDDNRADLAGQLARRLADDLGPGQGTERAIIKPPHGGGRRAA